MEVLTNHESFVRNGVALALMKVSREKAACQDNTEMDDVIVKSSHLGLLVDPKSNLQCPKLFEEIGRAHV